LNTSRKFAAVLLATLAGVGAAVYAMRAQPQNQISQSAQPPSLAMNRNLVVLDPAHGGPDGGAVLGDHVLEKDVTLAMAARLRAALTAAGFTVIATRDADAGDPPTINQRAEIANRTHAVACLVLHATATGSGVHVYTSALQAFDAGGTASVSSPSGFVPVPWEMAQAGYADESQHLASDLSGALGSSSLPVVVGRAPVLPLDNLMCPAVAVELAPLAISSGATTPVTDADYQQRVVASMAAALKSWRDDNAPAPRGTP
jgi:N-acetylmuramoyl-L-alanine amidase